MSNMRHSFRMFMNENSSFFLWIVLILSAYFKAWYVLYGTHYTRYLDGESALYWNQAVTSFYRGDFDPSQWSTLPTLAHVLLGWVFKIAYYFGLYLHKLEVVLGVNILLSTLSAYWVYRIALRLSHSGGYALLSAALYAFFFPFFYLDAFVLSDHPAHAALLLSLWMILRPGHTKLDALVSGMVLGVGVAIVPLLMPAAGAALLYVLWGDGWTRRALAKGLVFVTGLGIVLLGVSVQNNTLSVGKLKTFSANIGLEYYLNACRLHSVRSVYPKAPATYDSMSVNNPIAYGQAVVQVPFADQSYFFHAGTQCLRDNPPNLFTYLRPMHFVLHGAFYPDASHTLLVEKALNISSMILIGMMFLLPFTPLLLYDVTLHRSGIVLLLGIVVAQWTGMVFLGFEPRFALRVFFVVDLLGVLLLLDAVRIIRSRWKEGLLYLLIVIGIGYLYQKTEPIAVEQTSAFTLEKPDTSTSE